MIKVSNISKSFGEKKVLNGINMEIHPGQILVIEGPSGGGKTTLLRCVTLLDHPDEGTIEIDNQLWSFPVQKDVAVIPPYPRVTVVFQQLFLWPHLSNRENITIAARNHNHNYNSKLNELIEYLNMRDFIDNFPNQTSLGQKQRVALARALILDPRYIFFDEITSALDVEQIKNIIDLLLDLKKKNIGVFFITHNLHVADRIADNTLYLDKSKGIMS